MQLETIIATANWYVRLGLDWVVYVVVRVIICCIQSLSPLGCQHLAHALAFIFCDVLRVRRHVVHENLRYALPELTTAARYRVEREMWQHLFTMVCEIALARRKIHESNWRHYVRIVNRRELVGAFIDRRALVAVTAHLGNFEMCGYLSGLLGFPTYTIARPLDNRFLHNFLMQFRGATGQFVLPTKGSGQQAQQVIESGETLALLGDHYGGPKGCWVEFFHRPASCHKAISVFSLANRVPMAIVYTKRTDGFLQFELTCPGIQDPLLATGNDTIPELTQWYNRQIESGVRRTPGQYWWLHRRWKDTRRSSKAMSTKKGRWEPPSKLASSDLHVTSLGDATSVEAHGNGDGAKASSPTTQRDRAVGATANKS